MFKLKSKKLKINKEMLNLMKSIKILKNNTKRKNQRSQTLKVRSLKLKKELKIELKSKKHLSQKLHKQKRI